MNAKWGQRLGNIIAIVTLLTAAGAIYLLRSRHEPAQRGEAATSADSPRGGIRK